MSDEQATPRPWAIDLTDMGEWFIGAYVAPKPVRVARQLRSKADAELIVEAVNNYPALVAAARAVVEAKEQTLTTWGYVHRSAAEGPFRTIFSAIDALAALLPDAAAGGDGV
jgi:hypothetical protein